MKTRFAWVAVLIFLLGMVALAQTFQAGKILSITKHNKAQDTSGHTDAPLKASVDDYDVTISSGGTVYTAIYHHPGDLDPTWAEGKEVPVYVKGKSLNVKSANGKRETLRIVSSQPEGS